jgi:hypothetical protein
MKQKLIKENIILMYNAMFSENFEGAIFNYGLKINEGLIFPQIEALKKAAEVSKEFKKFHLELKDLNVKYAKKNTDGSPVIEKDLYVIDPDQMSLRDTEFLSLREKFAEEIKRREKQLIEYDGLLKEEVEIDFFEIKLSDCPSNLKKSAMDNFHYFIIAE